MPDEGIKIKIEKAIPMPGARASQLRYPFSSMLVGDSFAVAIAHTASCAMRPTWPVRRSHRSGSGAGP